MTNQPHRGSLSRAVTWRIIRSVISISVVLGLALGFSGCQGEQVSSVPAAKQSTPVPTETPVDTSSETPPAPSSPTATPAAPQVTSSPPAEATPSVAEVMAFLVDGQPYHGPEDAPVVIIDFSDYVCPFCGKFVLETLPKILETYPDEVKFVHRNLPLIDADASYRTALAARCAGDQGKFWDMHDVMFAFFDGFDFDSIDHSAPRDSEKFQAFLSNWSDDRLIEYAQTAGLDTEAFTTCMTGENYRNDVLFDYQIGRELGIQSLPFFIINGKALNGARSFDVFQQVIDLALAEASESGQ